MLRAARRTVTRSPRGMDRSLWNVIVLGVAFLLIFSAFNTQGFVQIKVLSSYANDSSKHSDISPHSGYYGFSILYAVFTVSNFAAPPIVSALGAKWAMVLGALCYCMFLLSFLHLTAVTFYMASALVGFGAAVLWTGQGNYLTAQSTPETISRNSGILWGLFQGCFIAGGLFLYFVLKNSSLEDVGTMRLMYTVFSAVCGVGILTLIALPSPRRSAAVNEPNEDDTDALIESISASNSDIIEGVGSEASMDSIPPTARNWKQEFVTTFRLLLTREMLLLSVVFMYSGLEMTFFTGVFSTCIANTKAFGDKNDSLIAFNAFALGAGQIFGWFLIYSMLIFAGGLIFGVFSYKTVKAGRNPIILLGTISHIVAFFLIFISIPGETPLHEVAEKSTWMNPSRIVILLCGFLLGFADSCWNTQIYSLLGQVYAKNSSSAFALYKFFQSLAACASFFYGSVLFLHWQLLILAITAAMAAICYFPVEWKAVSPTNFKIA